MEKETETDRPWYFLIESRAGRLNRFLETIPQAEWTRPLCDNKWTLLHHASIFDNISNIRLTLTLINQIPNLNLDVKTKSGHTPLMISAIHGSTNIVKILLAAGASVKHFQYLPRYDSTCVNILICNGLRNHIRQSSYSKKLEQGVLQCRDIIVILLGLKKRRALLPKLDRFLIQQELAAEIWSTRRHSDETWQKIH